MRDSGLSGIHLSEHLLLAPLEPRGLSSLSLRGALISFYWKEYLPELELSYAFFCSFVTDRSNKEI